MKPSETCCMTLQTLTFHLSIYKLNTPLPSFLSFFFLFFKNLVYIRPTLLLENYQPWLDLKVSSKVDASLSEVK